MSEKTNRLVDAIASVATKIERDTDSPYIEKVTAEVLRRIITETEKTT